MKTTLKSSIFKGGTLTKRYSKNYHTADIKENASAIDQHGIKGWVREMQVDGIYLVSREVSRIRSKSHMIFPFSNCILRSKGQTSTNPLKLQIRASIFPAVISTCSIYPKSTVSFIFNHPDVKHLRYNLPRPIYVKCSVRIFTKR